MFRADNYYFILQISSEANLKEIKAAFRRLARQYHPDLNPNDPEAAEQFKLISQAYDILSDPIKRSRYDRDFVPSTSTHSQHTPTPASGTSSTSAQDYYLRGLHQSQNKEYHPAIKNFTKAIELDPKFIEAYVKRCETRNKLGDNQGVLDDCYQMLQISPHFSKAYYYQGRARASLGYIESAIISYNQALEAEPNYAQAYYYRGIARKELKDNVQAVYDLQKASDFFRLQKNHPAYRRTQKILEDLGKSRWTLNSLGNILGSCLNDTLIALTLYLFNPSGGLLPAFARLESTRALTVGSIYGAISSLCFVASSRILNPQLDIPLEMLFFIGILPFAGLVFMGKSIRMLDRHGGNIAMDIFIAGAAMVPLGFAVLIIGLISLYIIPLVILLGICGFSYSVLTLYAGYTQILNFSEEKAALVVPLVLTASTCLLYLVLELFDRANISIY
jgi:tetratricopeptide (TPR) repeat protein